MAQHGLVVDDESAFEDCAYVCNVAGESDEERARRIDGMVAALVAAYSGSHILAPSYDPAEREQGMTVLESEWRLLKRQLHQ